MWSVLLTELWTIYEEKRVCVFVCVCVVGVPWGSESLDEIWKVSLRGREGGNFLMWKSLEVDKSWIYGDNSFSKWVHGILLEETIERVAKTLLEYSIDALTLKTYRFLN